MNINVRHQDITTKVTPVRKVGADGKTYRGIRLELTTGDAIVFWLNPEPDITLGLALAFMADQAHLLGKETERGYNS